jgi:hypothetical protein
MPYSGRCLNVGRTGKRGTRHQNTAQFNSTAVRYFARLNRLRTRPACDYGK